MRTSSVSRDHGTVLRLRAIVYLLDATSRGRGLMNQDLFAQHLLREEASIEKGDRRVATQRRLIVSGRSPSQAES